MLSKPSGELPYKTYIPLLALVFLLGLALACATFRSPGEPAPTRLPTETTTPTVTVTASPTPTATISPTPTRTPVPPRDSDSSPATAQR